jgi:hypothetical protein
MKKMNKIRSKLALAIFVTIVVLLLVSSAIPVEKGSANQTQTDVNKKVSELRTSNTLMQFFFGNNLMLCMVMLLPFAGTGFGLFAIYNTGRVIGAEAIAQNSNFLSFNLSLYFTPVFWLEFVAYALAMTESAIFTYYLITNRSKIELPKVLTVLSICAILLFAGAVTETLMISGYTAEAYALFFVGIIGWSLFMVRNKIKLGSKLQ